MSDSKACCCFFFLLANPTTVKEHRTKELKNNMKSRKKSDPQNKASKRFLFDDHYIDSHNLSTWLCINVVRRKLMLVTDLRVEKLEALLVCGLLERKYYCMRNFYYLIGLQRWYFSSIWNTYVWKLQLTFAVSSINKYGHDLYVIFGTNITRDISKLSQLLRIAISKYHSWNLCQISLQIMLLPIQTAGTSAFSEFCNAYRHWANVRPV